MASALLTIAVAVGVGAAFILFRNNWVCNQRLRLNDEHSAKVRRAIRENPSSPLVQNMGENWFDSFYLSYDQMLWRFWIWDVEKMRKATPEQSS